ncbi:MAG: TfuA-like protein [Deltaproteobacteria bacterium]
MKFILFSGPSLPADVARELLPGIEIRPPAACGDIYRASLERPLALGLVDGYFDHRLSVWHKEILWALHRGIHVYGASSMGALRAAELAAFGMVGVGWVFEQFRSGRLEDDDEVALLHEPATEGYRTRSEAMVNLRVTLQRAVEAGSLTETSQARLIAELKRLFYPQRTRAALQALCSQTMSSVDAARFRAWLEQNGLVDQKQLDAQALLRRLDADRGTGVFERPPPQRPFHPTNAWQALLDSLREEGRAAALAAAAPEAAALEPRAPVAPPPGPTSSELDAPLERLLARVRERFPERHTALVRQALGRALAVALARTRGVTADAAEVQRASEEFRRQRGLLDPRETARWLSLAGLDLVGFSSLIQDGVLERGLASEQRRALFKQLQDLLCLNEADAAWRTDPERG